jgi:acetylornithine aminotransferase
VLVEPVQGESGVRIPAADYLAGLRALCNEHDWLLMLDEIQTGIGRTGKMFAFQHEAIQPDVMTLAKALGNGVPIGACLARGKAAELFQPGNHGSTFGGNPLACSAGLAVLDTLQKYNIVEHAAKIGEKILSELNKSLKGLSAVTEIRGKGLIIGIELDRPCGELVKQALAQGLLINVTAERVIRLLPPLIINDAEAQQLVEQLTTLIRSFVSESAAA